MSTKENFLYWKRQSLKFEAHAEAYEKLGRQREADRAEAQAKHCLLRAAAYLTD